MKKYQLVILCLAALLASSAQAQDGPYLCIPDEAVGFSHIDGSGWRSANFDISEDKFILRKLKEGDMRFDASEEKFGVFDFGEDLSFLTCTVDQDGVVFSCEGFFGGSMNFSTKSLKFIKTYTFGYWVDGLTDSPYIMRGRCSEL